MTMQAADQAGSRILVVEDEEHVAEGLRLNLHLAGFDVKIAATGTQALEMYRSWRPHLIVLDIMLPKMDGFAVLKNIRLSDERTPILILSAKGDAQDRIKGLSLGVDDYLAKPFNLQEFLLRAQRLLLRCARPEPTGQMGEALFTFGENTVDLASFSAQTQRGPVRLSGQEARLLQLFFKNPNKVLSRKELLEVGWGYTAEVSTRTVDNFLVRFRKYFEEKPKKPRFFKSIRGVGYLFDPSGQ